MDMNYLRRRGVMSSAHTESLSDDIVSFHSDYCAKIKDLTVQIEPVQDLHGQTSPYPAGGGKNLIRIPKETKVQLGVTWDIDDDGTINSSGTSTAESYSPNIQNTVLPAGSYTARIDSTNQYVVLTLTSNGSWLREISANETWTFTLYDESTISGWVKIAGGKTATGKTYIQIEKGSTATSYAPYQNICPITGWTGVDVVRCGKNVANASGGTNVSTTNASTALNSVFGSLKCKPNTRYTFSISTQALETESSAKIWYARFKYSDGSIDGYGNTIINGNSTSAGQTMTRYSVTSESGKTVVAIAFNQGTSYQVTYKDIQLEEGTSASDYTPYSGTTYPISWTSQGTVYGGTLDVTSGVLTVTYGNIASYNGETLPGEWISDRDVYEAGTTPTAGAQVVYELETPVTYQLTAQELKTLLGQNNIWATTGDTSVEYWKWDPKSEVII